MYLMMMTSHALTCHPEAVSVLLVISGSEPEEIALESSQAVVIPKFDMHIYTSTLTIKELKQDITDYCIPTDLPPHLPSPELTMDNLPPNVIYIKQLKQGGLRIPFSTFFLAVIKHFGVHVSQLVPMGVNRVIMFEIRCRSLDINASVSLFWRHIDTDVRIDFPTNYNEGDADRLAEYAILLCPPPRHLLYVCGLTMTYRHPELSYSIKYPNGQGDLIPDDQRPPNHTTPPLAAGKLIPEKSPAQRSIEKPNTKVAETREKKEKLASAKVQLKRVGEGSSAVPRKKRARKPNEAAASDENTRVPTPPVNTVQTEQAGHGDTQENIVFSDGDDEDATAHRFSLAIPIGLCFTAGWLILGRKEEEIAAMLSETINLDIEGSKTWKEKHRELFTKQYTYVQKIVDSYRLPVDALLKVSPDVPPPQPVKEPDLLLRTMVIVRPY
uniref:Transposase (putative) gypsy type domain-containing protein n=1 Tax=Tanacetum cinerariifolium TaxID=118510 RepID=A0A6L2J733_TANCI|nr:hypothetical protein [Tanacetum cinerariifolium]